MNRRVQGRAYDVMRLINVVCGLCLMVGAGCGRKPPAAPAPDAPETASPETSNASQPPVPSPAAQPATDAAAASPPTGGLTIDQALAGPAPNEQTAGYIFNIPVPLGNYYFAKRVLYTFPHPWEEGLSEADRERAVWENLILHYESYQRNITVSDEEFEKRINSVLKNQQQSFTRAQDPAAYAAWVQETLHEDVELFENQMRYLLQIDKLKEQMRTTLPVTVTEDEMRQEFLNEQHHVGGEMVTFDTKEDAQAFYEQVKDPEAWARMKAKGDRTIRPVSLMTLEAYMDLWSIPKEQMYAFHALPVGAVGAPMPFGKQWCVYHLLEKRVANLEEFPGKRDEYYKQLTLKKQYEALKQWIEDLKASAHLKVLPLPKS